MARRCSRSTTTATGSSTTSYGEGDRALVLTHGLLMNHAHVRALRARDGGARQPGHLHRPARPWRLRRAARALALLDDRLRRPDRGAARPPRASTRRSSAAPRWGRTSRSSSASRTPTGRAACSSRCRSSTTRSSPSRWRSRRCWSALSSGRRSSGSWPRLARRIPRSQLPRRHRPRLDPARPAELDPGPPGPAARPHLPAARRARGDRGAGGDRRPPLRPDPPLQRLRRPRPRDAERAPRRRQLDHRVAAQPRRASTASSIASSTRSGRRARPAGPLPHSRRGRRARLNRRSAPSVSYPVAPMASRKEEKERLRQAAPRGRATRLVGGAQAPDARLRRRRGPGARGRRRGDLRDRLGRQRRRWRRRRRRRRRQRERQHDVRLPARGPARRRARGHARRPRSSTAT